MFVKAVTGIKAKNTDDLQQELIRSSNLNRFLSENQQQFCSERIADCLNDLFQKKNISKAMLAKRAGIS